MARASNFHRRPLRPEEIFIGAVVAHSDIDTYVAVIDEFQEDKIRVYDIYGGHDELANQADLFPRHLDHFIIDQLGFEFIKMDARGFYRFMTPSGPIRLEQVIGSDLMFLANVGTGSVIVEAVTELQLFVFNALKEIITIKKPDGADED